ncbi:MAG: flippase [Polyangiaceae bacterium]|nr:flippase [Polyangiaceae bacterium]
MLTKQVVMAVLGIVFVGYLARTVGVAHWGEFQASLAIVNVVTIAAGIGVRGYLAREIVLNPELGPRHLGSALAIRGITGTTLLAATVIVGLTRSSGTASTLLVLAAIGQLATLLYGTLWLSFEAHERFQYIVYAELAARLFVIVFASALLWAGYGVVAAAFAFALGNIIELAMTVVWLRARLYLPRFEVGMGGLLRIAWLSLPLGLCGAMSVALRQADHVVLRWLCSESAVGIYAAARVLTENFAMLQDVLLTSAFAAGVRQFNRDPAKFKLLFERCMLISVLLGLPIAAGGLLLAPDIIQLVYGERFAASAGVLRVLICQVPIAFAYQVGILPLLAAKRELAMAKLLGCMLVSNLVLNALLAPRFGPWGSAWTSLIVSACALFGTLFMNARWLRGLDFRAFGAVVLSTLVMALAASIARAASGMFVAIVVGAVVYSILVLVTGAVRWGDVVGLVRGERFQKR